MAARPVTAHETSGSAGSGPRPTPEQDPVPAGVGAERETRPGRVPDPLFRCGHALEFHDINAKKRRTACSVSTGPDGWPCGCPAYEPLTEGTPE